MPMKKEQVDLENAVVWIPDSKTPNGSLRRRSRIWLSTRSRADSYRRTRTLVVSERRESDGPSEDAEDRWHATLRRAKVPYFRIYDLRSTYATRLSAGGVADEWVTQLLAARRCEGVQEVLADETTDEKGGAAEDQPEGERKPDGF